MKVIQSLIEDMIRLNKLDPYEALIKCDIDQKQDQKSI